MKCLCGCGKPARARGVDHATYMAALRMVRRGEKTWKELEAAGVVRAAARRQRSRLTKRVRYLLSQGGESGAGKV